MSSFFDKNHTITKIVLACYVPVGAGKIVHTNRTSHGFALNLTGEKNYCFSNGKKINVKPYELIYLPKNSNYNVETIIAGETYCINFLIDDETEYQPFSVKIKNVEKLLTSYKSAENAWRLKKNGYEYVCLSEIYKIIYETFKQYSSPYVPNAKANILTPAIDYIRKNYTSELINVESLSELCGISYEYFRRLFHSVYDCSPVKYINDLKLSRAKELISSGLYTVSEVAFHSGFSDASHFSRFFKKATGIAPINYKK